MALDGVLRELAEVLAGADGVRARDARLRAARQVVVRHCLAALDAEAGEQTLGAVIRLAAACPSRPPRRVCAALLVHALAVRGLVPPALLAEVCALAEDALRDALLRCSYPFGGTLQARLAMLERLHRSLAELMQPLEPTFPNWQGLYAG